jgi:hypothetical protein
MAKYEIGTPVQNSSERFVVRGGENTKIIKGCVYFCQQREGSGLYEAQKALELRTEESWVFVRALCSLLHFETFVHAVRDNYCAGSWEKGDTPKFTLGKQGAIRVWHELKGQVVSVVDLGE